MKKDALLLIDGFNLLSRGYFATAYNRSEDQLPKSKDGLYTNGIMVFFQKLFKLIRDHEITHLGIAWDVKREELGRRQKYAFYKANRGELPFPLIQQYETLKEVLENIGVTQLVMPPHEADDIIGTISRKWSEEIKSKCFIYSNDKDLFQLLNEHTSQIISAKKNEIVYTVENFKEDYEISSKQWVDVKALLGDPSDNIPGCPGVGEKSALPLIKEYESIERLYEEIETLDKKFNRYKKKLIEGKELAFMSKELAKIYCNIEGLNKYNFDKLKLDINEDRLEKSLEELDLKMNVNLPVL